MNLKVFMVAGEASSDLHAAALVRELKSLGHDLQIHGVGGTELNKEGMHVELHASQLSIVGFTGWWKKLGKALSGYKSLCRLVKVKKFDVAILLDLPDFNLMMAKKLKKAQVPVVYYISPQVWAWRKYRLKKIKKYVDQMIVLFPFEKDFYEKHGIQVAFAGHPLVDLVPMRSSHRESSEVRKAPRIALLPGSRETEVSMHAAILSCVSESLRSSYPNAEFQVPIASTLSTDFVNSRFPEYVQCHRVSSKNILEWADLAVVASGTATLETALVGTPFCLFYKFSALNSFLFKHLVRYKSFLGMPNLLLRSEVVKEFILDSCTSDNIYKECMKLIEESEYRANLIESLRRCRNLLETEGASHYAAKVVEKFVSERKERAFLSSPATTEEALQGTF